MQNIADISKYPDKTPVKEIQARIKTVYKYEPNFQTKFGVKSKQDFIIEDSTGSMKAEIWEHPDITSLQGREFVLSSTSQGKGLSVKEYQGKVSLMAGKAASIQTIEVHHQQAGTSSMGGNLSQPRPASLNTFTAGNPLAIAGIKVGMAINNAVLLETTVKGKESTIAGVQTRAMEIILLSNFLEEGGWSKPNKEANLTPPVVVTKAPATPDAVPAAPDDDVPF